MILAPYAHFESCHIHMGLDVRKPVFGGLRTTQTQTSLDADQPALPHSLISAFVIRVLESTISKLATSEISTFMLVSVSEETVLKLALSETPKTGFLAKRPTSYDSYLILVYDTYFAILVIYTSYDSCHILIL